MGDYKKVNVMKARIQIINVVQFAGRSKKTGNDYDMRNAQCVVHKPNDDGVVMPLIGVLSLPEAYKDARPGLYDVEFESMVNSQGRVGAQVLVMTSVKPGTPIDLSPSGKNLIEVLSVQKMAGRSAKNGKDYDMDFAQCIVRKTDPKTGEAADLVGELLLPSQYKGIAPGEYSVDFVVAISLEKKIGSQVLTMTPISQTTTQPATSTAPLKTLRLPSSPTDISGPGSADKG